MNQTHINNIEALRARITGDVIAANDSEYDVARVTYTVADARPTVIIRVASNEDIATGIQFARNNNLQLSIRSGKHSAAGFSTNNNGVVLDLSHLNTINILDEKAGLVRLGTGAQWGDVAAKLDEHHLAISSGDTKSVGVGGLTLGGGIGWMVRKYGFAIDSLVAAEVVLADGSVVQTNESENSDLFWAIRGGGGNFGVVTMFTFRAHHLPGKIVASTLVYEPNDLIGVITGWRDYMRSATEDLTSFMTLMPGVGARPALLIITSCYAGDDETKAGAVIDPLRKLGKLRSEDTSLKPYPEMLQEVHLSQSLKAVTKNMFIKVLNEDVISAVADISCKPGSPIVQLRIMHGAADRVDSKATALVHRNNEAFLSAGFMIPTNAPDEQVAQSLGRWDKLAVHSAGVYSNFLSTNTAEDVASIYPKAVYERLAKIKQRYDPENSFNHNFNIVPEKI